MSNATTARNPADFLKQILGRVVLVKLNSGLEYSGFFFFCSRFKQLKKKSMQRYTRLLRWVDEYCS